MTAIWTLRSESLFTSVNQALQLLVLLDVVVVTVTIDCVKLV